MRITFNSHYRDAQAGLETASEQLVDLQRQVATGKRINRPSDAPADAASAITERAALASVEHFERTADSVAARLAIVDSALSDIIERITEASAAVASVRGSGKSAAQQEAAASQLASVRDTIISDLNSSFRGAYLFGGTESSGRPFTTDGTGTATYEGNGDEAAVDVSGARAVTVAFDGRDVTQGSDATDLLAVLADLITAARTGDQATLEDGAAALTRALERSTQVQARVGSAIASIDVEKVRLQQDHLAGTTRVAALENANMAEVISGMAQADAAYRAALGAIGTAGRVSLMDYLK
ncbi:MAG: hypothetical protein AB7P99_05100 [Vicinamibacterales bacterium]